MLTGPEKEILHLVENPELVFQFFIVFSRFEYALKRSGFLRPKEPAEADWEGYAKGLRGKFAAVGKPAFQDACEYLKREPPRKQIIDHGALGWKNTVQGEEESEECYLLRLVRTVRNNLFHGGKYPVPVGPVLDATRNRHLIESCLTVLQECLRLSPNVKHAFEEAV